MRRLVASLMVLVLSVAMTAASAGSAGMSDDPLVSKSFVDEELVPDLVAAGYESADEALKSVLENAVAGYDDGGYDFASGYVSVFMPKGSGIELTDGASAILHGGSASISASEGSVIDVSLGEELTGGAMKLRVRYFLVEDTHAVVRAEADSAVLVSGDYRLSDGAERAVTAYGDVAVTAWYYKYIKYIRDNGYYHDWDAASFHPNVPTTRAELVYALWVAAGRAEAASETFSDVPASEWYAEAVAWAARNRIVNGYGDGRFGPENSVTREQVAAIMYRYAVYKGDSVSARNDLSGYTDREKISDWALEEMRWANAEGLITGKTTTTLVPSGTATRAELAAIIMRFLESRS